MVWLNERVELYAGVQSPEYRSELDAVTRLHNRTLGPITSVQLHRPDLFDLSLYAGSGGHTPVKDLMPDLSLWAARGTASAIPGGGKGFRMDQAVSGALGELAERLLAVLHFAAAAETLELATFEALAASGRTALGPEDLPLFAPEQYCRWGFDFVPFRPDTRLAWLPGQDLLTGNTVMVPAQLVLMYHRRQRGEERIGYPTSGGLSFGANRERTILHALYELIERDAINVRWYCRLPPTRVDLSLDSVLSDVLGVRDARASTTSLPDVRIYDNTLDVPLPVLTAVAIDRARAERTFFGGGGAGATPGRALAHALLEIGQCRTVMKLYRPRGLKVVRPNTDARDMTDFLDGALFFGFPENRDKLAWYTETTRKISWSEIRTIGHDDDLRAVLETVHGHGLKPILVDLDGGAWPGVSIIKLLVPQLTQPSVPSHPYLGHPRFTARSWGADRPRSFADLTAEPVPFP